MNERDELLKKIDESLNQQTVGSDGMRLASNNSPMEQYNKANTNLNVTLNNPKMTVADNDTVNIVNSNSNNNSFDSVIPTSEIGLQTPSYSSQNNSLVNGDPINPSPVNSTPTQIESEAVNNRFISDPQSIEGYNSNSSSSMIDNTKYVATYESTGKKKNTFKLKLSKETQLIFIIFLVIFIFIMILPNISDFSNEVTKVSFWEKIGNFFKNLFKR